MKHRLDLFEDSSHCLSSDISFQELFSDVGVLMDPKVKNGNGVKLLKQMYRKRFRIPENTEHYSKEDYKRAEKKYVKLCLITGTCEQ